METATRYTVEALAADFARLCLAEPGVTRVVVRVEKPGALRSAIVVFTIAAALVFDIINGFHDAANCIATVVSTRVLSPRIALLWAAFFNFVALLIFHEGVAKTISGIIHIKTGDPAFVYAVMSGLLGAIAWNLLPWWWGLPSSSSPALLGGVGGAGVAYAGFGVLVKAKVYKVLYFIIIAPLVGFVLGSLIMLIVYWLFRKTHPQKVDRIFRIGQLLSAASYSIGHGGNDAQKTMGIIGRLREGYQPLSRCLGDEHGASQPAYIRRTTYLSDRLYKSEPEYTRRPDLGIALGRNQILCG